MRSKGYKPPKWILENHRWPTKWRNTNPDMLEDAFVIDISIKKA